MNAPKITLIGGPTVLIGAHFTQTREDIETAFKTFGLTQRLRLLEPGVPAVIGA
jgi:hypothetical protein